MNLLFSFLNIHVLPFEHLFSSESKKVALGEVSVSGFGVES